MSVRKPEIDLVFMPHMEISPFAAAFVISIIIVGSLRFAVENLVGCIADEMPCAWNAVAFEDVAEINAVWRFVAG